MDIVNPNSGPLVSNRVERSKSSPLQRVTDNKIRFQQLTPEQLSRLQNYQLQTQTDIESIRQPCRDPMQAIKKDPAAYTAFGRLSPEDQRLFLQLCNQVPASRGGGMLGGITAQLTGGISPDLLKLLKSGKLTQKDSKGNTLLQNLAGLAGQTMGPRLDKGQVLYELVRQLADPGRIRQGNRNTCGPATLEHLQASTDPAEYARIVAGLTSEKGEVELRGGETLKRDRGSLAPDDSRRSNISRLYQSAMMELANGENEYDNRTDVSTRENDETYTGLYQDEMERALDQTLGDKFDFHRTTGAQDTEAKIRKALSQGGFVPVLMNWSPDTREWGGHYLVVTGMTENSVILRNPWGSGDVGQNGPERELLDHQGTVEMSKSDFLARVSYIALPKEDDSHSLDGILKLVRKLRGG